MHDVRVFKMYVPLIADYIFYYGHQQSLIQLYFTHLWMKLVTFEAISVISKYLSAKYVYIYMLRF